MTNFGYAYPSLTPHEPPVWVLRDVSFEIEDGEFVSIMGATGAGKTTLCLALNGIVPQSTGGTIKGQVLVDGRDTKRTPVPELAQRVGLVFQDPETQFFIMSVEAEIAFGLETQGVDRSEMRERITWALDLVGMRGLEKRSPFHLSGGQKQRVAIAAILAMLPKVLVLDDPTSSLDPVGKAEIFNVLQTLRQKRNMTIIMVEQDSERIAEFSDRVIVLRDGVVELEDTPARVFAQVGRMFGIGLSVPPVTQLASCLERRLHRPYHFIRFDEAFDTLKNQLEYTA
jgi:energy-coupling factor transporter ATP-binding protein EcfA2